MSPLPDPMPENPSDAAWAFLARVVRERREFIGLSQEDLATYGGPGKSTVSKIERAAQKGYPARTQQQLEKALGWSRGAYRSILGAVDRWDEDMAESVAVDFIEDELPDLTATPEVGVPARSASDLTDDELLAELTYRMKRYALENGGTGDGDDLAKKRTRLKEEREKVSEVPDSVEPQAAFDPARGQDEPVGESEGDAP